MKKLKLLCNLFTIWFKMGLFTFGGGYAMLPMIEKEVIEKHKWATEEEIMEYYAIAQCTPGIIAVNTATFVGYFQAGIIGGIIATLGVVAPSVVIITIIASVLTNFMDIVWVQHALAGIQVAVCYLMIKALIKLSKNNFKDAIDVSIFVVAFALATFTHISMVYLVVLFALVGVIRNLKKFQRKGENV